MHKLKRDEEREIEDQQRERKGNCSCSRCLPSSATHLVESLDIDASRFGEVPDITGAVVQCSFGPPLELLFGPSNFGDAETYVASSAANFPCWNDSLRSLLQAGKHFANCMASSGAYTDVSSCSWFGVLGQVYQDYTCGTVP
jgi:hypothetical protein